MTVFWTTLAALFFGALIGYHLGLWRAAQAYREAQVEPRIPVPVREGIINECIAAVVQIRPDLHKDKMSMEDYNRAMWFQLGVDDAIDVLQRIDKRGAGHYGVPLQVADMISRRALDREAKKEANE